MTRSPDFYNPRPGDIVAGKLVQGPQQDFAGQLARLRALLAKQQQEQS